MESRRSPQRGHKRERSSLIRELFPAVADVEEEDERRAELQSQRLELLERLKENDRQMEPMVKAIMEQRKRQKLQKLNKPNESVQDGGRRRRRSSNGRRHSRRRSLKRK